MCKCLVNILCFRGVATHRSIIFKMLEGGQISRRASCFSGDGKLVLAPVGCSVNIYAAATGEQVGQLEGHSGDVTCVMLDPKDSEQVGLARHLAAKWQLRGPP